MVKKAAPMGERIPKIWCLIGASVFPTLQKKPLNWRRGRELNPPNPLRGFNGFEDRRVKSPSWDESQKWDWAIMPLGDAKTGEKFPPLIGWELVGLHNSPATGMSTVYRKRTK